MARQNNDKVCRGGAVQDFSRASLSFPDIENLWKAFKFSLFRRLMSGEGLWVKIFKCSIAPFAILGGKIEDLHRAFMAEYAYMGNPVDVVLAAGMNNLDMSMRTYSCAESEPSNEMCWEGWLNICNMHTSHGAQLD